MFKVFFVSVVIKVEVFVFQSPPWLDYYSYDNLRFHRVAIMQAGLTLEDVESFEFNTLDLDDFQTYAALIWFLCGENLNLGSFITETLGIDEKRVSTFLEEMSCRYLNTNPYHNWLHAVDVTHCVHQFLIMCKTREFFSAAHRFALIMAAVCHDVGHPGLNNPFLVESRDPLALRYNDKSPLENMHCAIMFEYALLAPETSILHKASKNVYMDIRQVAVEAILHTDMVWHFSMVNEIKLLAEENSDMIRVVQEEFWEQLDSEKKIFGEDFGRSSSRGGLLRFFGTFFY